MKLNTITHRILAISLVMLIAVAAITVTVVSMDTIKAETISWNKTIAIPKNETWGYAETTCILDTNPQLLEGYDEVVKMWFRGNNLSGDAYLFYAESADGLVWTFANNGDPILMDNNGMWCPYVLKNNGVYYLYVHNGWGQIDRFNSPNGMTWTKDAEDIIPLGASGTWDDNAIGNLCVWVEGSTWYMIYEADEDSSAIWNMGLATSSNGISWTKYTGNPLTGMIGTDQGGPEVIKIDDVYYMFFHAALSGNLPTDVYLSSSTDLHTWTLENDGDPILERTLSYEGPGLPQSQVGDPSFVEMNGKVYLYYDMCVNQTLAGSSGIGVGVYDGSLIELFDIFTPEPEPLDWDPTITSTAVLNGTVGVAYSYNLTANETVTWTLDTAATWLTLNGSTLAGTPTETGSYAVTLTATSTAGNGSAVQTFTIVVVPAPGVIDENLAPWIGILFTIVLVSSLVSMFGAFGKKRR